MSTGLALMLTSLGLGLMVMGLGVLAMWLIEDTMNDQIEDERRGFDDYVPPEWDDDEAYPGNRGKGGPNGQA